MTTLAAGMKHKALSFKQPWLWCVLQKYKDIEIRNWNTTHRGVLYLHASKKFDNEGYEYLKDLGIQMPLKNHFETGKILGVATLYNVIYFKDVNTFFNYRHRHLNNPRWWHRNMKGLVLRDIKKIEPVEYKGKLGLFNIDLSSL